MVSVTALDVDVAESLAMTLNDIAVLGLEIGRGEQPHRAVGVDRQQARVGAAQRIGDAVAVGVGGGHLIDDRAGRLFSATLAVAPEVIDGRRVGRAGDGEVGGGQAEARVERSRTGPRRRRRCRRRRRAGRRWRCCRSDSRRHRPRRVPITKAPARKRAGGERGEGLADGAGELDLVGAGGEVGNGIDIVRRRARW